MNCSVILDWKSFGVLGLTAVAIILACKLDSTDAKEAFVRGADACKETATALIGTR